MARKPKPKPRTPDWVARHHWMTWVAFGGVALFAVTVISTNAIGWPNLIPGVLGKGAAVLAIAVGVLAFTFWEHVRLFLRERRWPNFIGALVIFLGAIAIDAIGVHSGIEVLAKPWRAQMETAALERQRGAQLEIDRNRAEIEAEIAAAQARVDAVPLVLPGRPQSDEQARLAWNEMTAADRARIEARRAELDAAPRHAAPERAGDWLTPAIWGFAMFAGLVVAFGASILGIEIAPQFAARGEEEEDAAPPARAAPPRKAENVTPLPRKRVSIPMRIEGAGQRWSGWD